MEVVRELPDRQQEVVILRYFDGLTFEEMGARLGEKADTVRMRLRRALAEVRSRLDRRHDGDRGAWCGLLLLLLRDPAAERPRRPAASIAMPLIVAGVALLVVTLAMLFWAGAFRVTDPADSSRIDRRPAHGDAAPGRAAMREDGEIAEAGHESRTLAEEDETVGVRIVDRRGRAVAGVEIWERGEVPRSLTHTDAEGRATFARRLLPLSLVAVRIGFVPKTIWLPEDAEETRVEIGPGVPLRIRVTRKETGQGLAGARIRLRLRGQQETYRWTVTTDAFGRATHPGVEPRRPFRLRVERDGCGDAWYEGFVENDPVDVPIEIPQGTTIEGVVTGPDGSPRPGARVFLQRCGGGPYDSAEGWEQALGGGPEARTDALGRYRFEGVGAPDTMLVGAQAGEREVGRTEGFPIDGPDRPIRRDVTVRPFARLRIRTSPPEASRDLWVELPPRAWYVSRGYWPSEANSADWSAFKGPFHPGEYPIVIRAKGFRPVRRVVAFEAGVDRILNVVFRPGRVLHGRVENENGAGLPDATVWFSSPATDTDPRISERASCDETGAFRFTALGDSPGSVDAMAPGFGRAQASANPDRARLCESCCVRAASGWSFSGDGCHRCRRKVR